MLLQPACNRSAATPTPTPTAALPLPLPLPLTALLMENEEALKAIDAVATRLRHSPNSESLLVELLQLLQTHAVRRPELVAKYGFKHAVLHGRSLGHKVWELFERVLVSALEVADTNTAEKCHRALSRKFPNSNRVKRLEGMIKESVGQFDQAMSLYDEILAENSTDLMTLKRRVSCCRGRGRWKDAIKALNELLRISASDVGAWRELAELYIHERMFSLAKFALEEVLLLDGGNYASYLAYAEILYTIGDKRSLETARQYYAMSLELNSDNNTRALLGLLLCVRLTKSNRRNIAEALREFASEKLVQIYSSKSKELLPFVEAVLLKE